MNSGSITIHPARPNAEDGLLFAHYADEAAEGSFRILLGRRAHGILAAVFVEPDHDYSYEHVLLAEAGGSVVGMAQGFRAVPGRCLANQPLLRAAGPRGRILRWAAAAGHPLFRIHSTLREGHFYLQFLAVEEGHRGRGIGPALIDAIEKRARADGSLRFAVDVWDRNPRAKHLYAGHGMTAESYWPRRIVIPGFGLVRMTKPL
ncbi:MAG: GNAT family N-acetyltransferase [Candidatus Bipolaricaulis sp.]|nr:GNAT family N-acetyltransferase [Candidatus Bipolaricaulis sp.]